MLYEPILQGKLEPEQVTAWIKQFDFPIPEEREDFTNFPTLDPVCLEVYVQLDQRNSLQDDLKKLSNLFNIRD